MIFCASSLLRVIFDYAREKGCQLCVIFEARLRVTLVLCHPAKALPYGSVA